MAFESLSEKLQGVFKNLRSKGRLTEDDVKAAMREVKEQMEEDIRQIESVCNQVLEDL